jgi:hypothetical protein
MEAGKIYWINDDFKHVGFSELKWEHSVARITKTKLDSNIVEIDTEPTDFGFGGMSISVNLIRDKGFSYSGYFRDLETGDFSGKADAELFLNHEEWVLIGNWYEKNEDGEFLKYTWIVKIKDKNAWQHFLKK